MPLALQYRGFNYLSYYNGDYAGDDSLPALSSTGANAITAGVEFGIDPQSDTVYASPVWTDSAEGVTIATAVAGGLSVMVKPHLDFLPGANFSGTPYSANEWRSFFNPGAANSTTADAFFASYKTMILGQAALAAGNGATWLCIGTELDQIAGAPYKRYWDDIIAAIRAAHPALKLTYAANWDADAAPWSGVNGLAAGTRNLATQISFASELDAFGIDEYAPLSNAADPSLDDLIAGWTGAPVNSGATALTYAVTGGQSLIAYYESVAAAVGKPLLFTELGYANSSTAASDPALSNASGVENDALQAKLYQAFFQSWTVAGNLSLAGVYFWNWDPNAAEVGAGRINFSPQGLPAQAVAKRFFSREAPLDFTGDGRSNVLFKDASGALWTWAVNGTTIGGGGELGSPGAGWAYLASADFAGDGRCDALWRSPSGALWYWDINGTAISGGGKIGAPGGTWAVAGTGDFNGDRFSDILFQNASGDLAIWELNGASVIGGGDIGNPGPGWTLKGVGDFNGDARSDLLFESASGSYAIWSLNGAAIVGAAVLGDPGAGWSFAGVGDFKGAGTSEILFENANGVYATWDIAGGAVTSFAPIGAPGPDWRLQAIGNYDNSAASDLLFANSATGELAIWSLNDRAIVGGGNLGAPGPGFSVVR
ncbi:MAG: hypothetical protein KGM15_08310 [Pseudomonadota bacterium]|nr:hypothetical protein [Pseudomonadota bacterium]